MRVVIFPKPEVAESVMQGGRQSGPADHSVVGSLFIADRLVVAGALTTFRKLLSFSPLGTYCAISYFSRAE
jgi:hypothetical protein